MSLDLLTEVTAAVGAITGVIGTSLGLRAYIRDTAKFRVDLAESVMVVNHPELDSGKPWGRITIVNTGRRPLFLQVAELVLSNGNFILPARQSPQVLEEGCEPVHVYFDRERLAHNGFEILCAFAQDGSGRRYYSRMSLRNRVRLLRQKFRRSQAPFLDRL